MKDKKKIIGIIAIVVAILSIVVTVGMYFYRNAKSEEKTEPKKATIELLVEDQEKFPAKAGTIQLSQVFSNGNKDKIMEVHPGSDGTVMFYDVPEGEYELEVIEEQEGYSFTEDNKMVRFQVKAGDNKKITWPCKRSIGLLIVTALNEQEAPIKDMEIEIVDSEGYIIKTEKTDAQGKAYFRIMQNATYYFRQNPECEKAKEYELDTTLYKMVIDEENKTYQEKFANTSKTTENE